MIKSTQNSLKRMARGLLALSLALTLLVSPLMALAENVLIETPLGNIEIELLEQDAPNTVANFLNYLNSDRYTNSFMHRSVPGFIIQGGGFTFINGAAPGVVAFAPVANEFKVSNTRGTVAMAKLNNLPDSATSQWFINLADNSANLDNQNGGFTVFARVVGDGMTVADAISALPRVEADGPFTELPTIDYTINDPITEANLVMTALTETQGNPDPGGFVMNAGLNDAWFNPATDGQGFFITVFPDLGLVSLAWFTYDTVLPDEGDSANLGDPGHRWLTAIGPIVGNSALMNIDIASGGLFDTATTIQRTDPTGADGTITLTFDNCGAGLVEYDIVAIDEQGIVPIQRIAGDNIALCEALSAE